MAPGRPISSLILPNLVRKLAEEMPDEVFLQEIGGRAATYGEVHDFAIKWAYAMRERGVSARDRVATIFATGIDGVVAWLACAYLGAVNVPISTAYIGYMLQHAVSLTSPKLLLTDARYVERLLDLRPTSFSAVGVREHVDAPRAIESLCGAYVTVDLSEFDTIGRQASTLKPVEARWEDAPALMFTSGTTGPSKAVIMRWLQLYKMAVHTCKTDYAKVGDTLYVPWPLNHISATGSIYAAALSRGTAVLREKWSTSSFMKDIYDHRCTFALLMLEMTRYVSAMELPSDRGSCPLERVYAVPTNPDLTPVVAKLGARYSTSYNSTEQSTPIVSEEMDPVPLGAAGKPRSGAEVKVVDDAGNEVAIGEVGELLTRTLDAAEMFAGYWQMPEATAAAMRGGWYHTGDAVRMDDEGYVYFLERMNDRIRHRGENVSPFDVETTLERDRRIEKSAAIGVPSAAYGEDEIVVFVVPSGEEPLSEDIVLEISQRTLPKFMRPSRVVIVERLPETPTGKVRRAELRSSLLRVASATRRSRA